ncbi:tetratricopeptide repeat protein [endosymbiont of Ridgeia piscesae]|jgi:putative thioredoxin|uniref:Negative regulator of GroEL n=1 Tax=endosymbiont of Ridgeia piscesae TaxID=54398 RepID=A0A0T5YV07_9GAMM|nr:tetratricopeptide repeat protein [endosymbiont of Ridgeia piscesae]KRT54362.1 Negative regulator of GroEL [endosymbiont of Ridgeia piscesae]KRT56831.1 putative thioredoxin [endosymbiont of Ridgeia piscesae]
MSDRAFIFEASSDNFDRLVLENSKKGLVVVDFWAPWAGPSHRQKKLLTGLANSYRGRFLLVSVNTDEQKALAARFGVRTLPSLKLFLKGECVEEYQGMQAEADYPRMIDRHLGRQLDQTASQAIALWQAGEPEQALQRLAQAAVDAPDKLDYPALMAKILMRQQRLEEAHQLLSALPEAAQKEAEISQPLAHLDFMLTAAKAAPKERLEASLQHDPDNPEIHYQLAALELHEEQLEAALERLLALSRSHPNFRNGIARKGMQAVLALLDPQDERVIHYRKELFRLNY